MKKFKFSLQAPLSYREHVEQMAKQEVATLQGEIIKCRERVNAFLKDFETASAELEALCRGGIDAGRYRFYLDYRSGLEMKADSEKKRLENLEACMKTKQGELLEKAVERKVLENLKERKKKEYFDNMEKVLQKESDEMALIQKSRS